MEPLLPPDLKFSSARLEFRPYGPGDAPAVAREMAAGGPGTALALAGIQEGFGLDLRREPEVLAFFAALEQGWAAGERAVFPVLRREDEVLAGELWIEARGNNEQEIGYFLWERFQGKGYATEAVRAVCELLWGSGARKLHIECDETNLASRAVARRSGFTLVRTGSGRCSWELRAGSTPAGSR